MELQNQLGNLTNGVELPADAPAADRGDEKKSKKKKYSRGLKELQKLERRVSKAQRRMAKAVLSGVDTWHQRTEKSAGKKRDGAIRDALENAARAHAESLKIASRVPSDLVSGMSIKPKAWMRVLFPLAYK